MQMHPRTEQTTVRGRGVPRGTCGDLNPKRRENEPFADYQKRRAFQNARRKKYLLGAMWFVSRTPQGKTETYRRADYCLEKAPNPKRSKVAGMMK